MPLSAQPVSRIRNHARSVRFDRYVRADGSRDMEACLADVRREFYPPVSGVRAAGNPVRDMRIRVTIRPAAIDAD